MKTQKFLIGMTILFSFASWSQSFNFWPEGQPDEIPVQRIYNLNQDKKNVEKFKTVSDATFRLKTEYPYESTFVVGSGTLFSDNFFITASHVLNRVRFESQMYTDGNNLNEYIGLLKKTPYAFPPGSTIMKNMQFGDREYKVWSNKKAIQKGQKILKNSPIEVKTNAFVVLDIPILDISILQFPFNQNIPNVGLEAEKIFYEKPLPQQDILILGFGLLKNSRLQYMLFGKEPAFLKRVNRTLVLDNDQFNKTSYRFQNLFKDRVMTGYSGGGVYNQQYQFFGPILGYVKIDDETEPGRFSSMWIADQLFNVSKLIEKMKTSEWKNIFRDYEPHNSESIAAIGLKVKKIVCAHIQSDRHREVSLELNSEKVETLLLKYRKNYYESAECSE